MLRGGETFTISDILFKMCETAVELKILPQSGCDIQERLGSFTFTAVMSILVKSKNKTHHHHPGAFRHTDEEEGKIKSH